MAKKFVIVIPARFKSKRFPGKPLIDIKGTPMIIRTAQQCAKVVSIKDIYIATDNKKIYNICKNNGFSAIITKKNILTGTDRVAEIAKKIKADYYINIQGDEPIFNPKDIKLLINEINIGNKNVLLGFSKIDNYKSAKNINTPKVIFDKDKFLIYASRNILPFSLSKKKKQNYYRQILAYSFPREKLMQFSKNKKKTFLEQSEDIEILRFLELGIKVQLVKMSNKSQPVDTKEDLRKVCKKINYFS